MTVSTNAKLGVLVLAAGAAAITATLVLGVRTMRSSTAEYHTYFDESVQGLDVGSPVKYRGVRIGRIAEIAIAPDRKHVDVALALYSEPAARLGIARSTPELRAQLATQGVTGVKFVDIDFFDPRTSPPPALPFAPAIPYIPARASLMKGLEDNLEGIGPRLPVLVDHLDATITKLSSVLDNVSEAHVAERFAAASDQAGGAAAEIRLLVAQLGQTHLEARAALVLDRASAAANHLDELAAKADGIPALIASAHRATDSLGDLGRSSLESREELDRSLRELGDAARAVHELADMVRHDPAMLVKGRTRTGKP